MTRKYRRQRDFRNLAEWQKEEYFGDHVGLYPAIGNLRGYHPTMFFDPNRVSRAIPVEGNVIQYSSFTEKAPQAWNWCKKDLLSGKQQIRTRSKFSDSILVFLRRIVK